MANEFDRPIERLVAHGYNLGADKIRKFIVDLEAKGEIPHRLKESKKKKPTVGERLLGIKQGAYWTREELDGIDLSGETGVFRSRVEQALGDIAAHNNDALSHLCLEGSSQNALKRDGIKTISALEAHLSRGGVKKKAVLSRLALFHQRLARQQPKPAGK